MKLEKIQEFWTEDCEIDRTDLGNESLKISKLHDKYYKMFINEKLILRKYQSDLKELRLSKYEFYTQGPTKEQLDLGWKLPPVGRIMKADVSSYIEADNEIVKLSLKIGLQQEKVEFLDSIIKSLNSRSFNIKNAIEWTKFTQGEF